MEVVPSGISSELPFQALWLEHPLSDHLFRHNGALSFMGYVMEMFAFFFRHVGGGGGGRGSYFPPPVPFNPGSHPNLAYGACARSASGSENRVFLRHQDIIRHHNIGVIAIWIT